METKVVGGWDTRWKVLEGAWVMGTRGSEFWCYTECNKLLGTVYDDIQRHGIEEEVFTKGVMYLLYKKKDKPKIENYRPLTLVETDYKILTKVIATR